VMKYATRAGTQRSHRAPALQEFFISPQQLLIP